MLQHAAARERVVDEHMFRAGEGPGARGTFRLQLFTAPGVRPVAVATQQWGGLEDDEGASLANAAETFAAVVWKRYFPDEAEPPIWIARSLSDVSDDSLLEDDTTAVTFTVTGPYDLSAPEWDYISAADVETLIGGPFDAGRGDGYVAAGPASETEVAWRVVPVMLLPMTRPFREPECMPRGRRRLIRQLLPRRTARTCCWYHGGNWHRVNRVAIRLVRAAGAAGVPGDDVPDWCRERLGGQGLTPWETQAVRSLLAGAGTAIDPDGEGVFVNGQHRTQAMRDAGVRRTVVARYTYPES